MCEEMNYCANDKIRIKVTDRCNMKCWFCHSEGAPNSNDMVIDNKLEKGLLEFRNVFNHAHITGGEPFLYPQLDQLLELLASNGYRLSITTNGLFLLNSQLLNTIKKIDYINISFHSLNGDYYSKLSDSNDGSRIVTKIKNNIIQLNEELPVRINTVVSGDGNDQYLEEMIQFAEELGCELKFVPQLQTKDVSTAAIESLLKNNNYQEFDSFAILPGSNVRNRYKNLNGNTIELKKLQPYFPDFICKDCNNKDKCDEGYSFFRIGGNPLYCQSCIKHSPLLFEEFMMTQWEDLKKEYRKY